MSLLQEYTPAAMMGGLTGLGARTFSDLGNIDRAASKWESGMEGLRSKLLPFDRLEDSNFKVNQRVADLIVDRYIKDGKNLARTRLLGLPMGTLMDRANPGAGVHYKMFTDPKVTNNQLRLHMMLKGWNAQAPDYRPIGLKGEVPELDIKRLSSLSDKEMPKSIIKALEKVLSSKEDLSVSQIIKRLQNAAQKSTTELDLADELMGKKPKPDARALAVVKELKHAIFGGRPVGLSGTSNFMPEVMRLAGMGGEEISTPTVYRRKIGDMFNKIRKFRTPALATGALTTGLLAARAASKGSPIKTWWEKLTKKFQTKSSFVKKSADVTADDILGAVLPSSLLAGGGYMASSPTTFQRLLNPNRQLAVTYGEMAQPYAPWPIGSGHKEPALGLKELLEEAIGEKGSKYSGLNSTVEQIARNRYGRINPEQYGKFYNTIIDTGLGLNQQPWGGHALGMSHGVNVDPRIKAWQMNYMQSDLADPLLNEMGASHPRPESYARAKLHKMLGTGPFSKETYRKQHGLGLIPGVGFEQVASGTQPAIRKAAYDVITKPADSKAAIIRNAQTYVLDPKNILNLNIQNPKELSNKLGTLTKPKSKMVFISGSGRGDFVASRAHELANKLEKAGEKNFKVIALMSDAYKDKQMMNLINKNKNIIALPRLAQKDFINMFRVADVHLGSYGASAFSEAVASGSVLGMPEDWGKRQFWGHEHGHPKLPEKFTDYTVKTPQDPLTIFKESEGVVVRPGSIADRELRMLAERGQLTKEHVKMLKHVNVDQWNEGQQHYFKTTIMDEAKVDGKLKYSKTGGAFRAETMDDVVKVLQDDKLLADLKQGAASRAIRELSKITAGRKKVVTSILSDALANVKAQRASGIVRLGGGLGLLGLGGAGLYDYLKG